MISIKEFGRSMNEIQVCTGLPLKFRVVNWPAGYIQVYREWYPAIAL
jgi:hypothetical protein